MRLIYFKLLLTTMMLCVLTPSITLAEQRLISTDANSTDLIMALGLGDTLVAVDVTSQLPKGHTPLPSIGYHRNLSAEGLLSMKPSAVIGGEHMGPPSVIKALQQAKIPLIQLPSAHNSEQLRNNIRDLATALKQSTLGEQLLSNMDQQLNTLQASPLKDENIAFLLNMDASKLRLAGTGTSGHALINLLGGNNIAEYENYRTISPEALLAMKPSIILVAGRDTRNAAQLLLTANPILAHTPAGKRHFILSVDGSALISGLSIAAVDEALRLNNIIQPTTAAR